MAIVFAGFGPLLMSGAAAAGTSESSGPGSSGPASSSPASSSPASSDTGPRLELRPSSTDFAAITVAGHTDRTVRIVNVGHEAITLGDVDVEGDGFEPLFDNCSGERIDGGDSCALTIRFTPPGIGSFDGLVVLQAPTELTGTLTGTGLSEAATSTVPSESTAPPQTTAAPATEPTTPLEATPPPTVTPPTVTAGDSQLAEQLRRCEADAQTASVEFAPQLEMVVGTSTDVHVVASIGSAGPEPSGSGPPTTVVPAVLHCEVEVTLRGQGFEIDPDDPQSGSFLDRPTIDWSWSVTPTSAGRRTLHVQVLPVAREGALQLPGTPILFEATIAVDAAPRSVLDRVDGVVRGVVGYPLVTSFGALAGIVTMLAATWRWILKRPWPWAATAPPRRDGSRP
jgi:hypothetical protein